MPFNKFFGKNKEDLILLATLGRVLTLEQARDMTQSDLAAFLYEKDQELEMKSTSQNITGSREKTPLVKKQKSKEKSVPDKAKIQEEQAIQKEKPTEKLSKRELNKQMFMQELATRGNLAAQSEEINVSQQDTEEMKGDALSIKTKKKDKTANVAQSATNINKRSKKPTVVKEAEEQQLSAKENDGTAETQQREAQAVISAAVPETVFSATEPEAAAVHVKSSRRSKFPKNDLQNLKDKEGQDGKGKREIAEQEEKQEEKQEVKVEKHHIEFQNTEKETARNKKKTPKAGTDLQDAAPSIEDSKTKSKPAKKKIETAQLEGHENPESKKETEEEAKAIMPEGLPEAAVQEIEKVESNTDVLSTTHTSTQEENDKDASSAEKHHRHTSRTTINHTDSNTVPHADSHTDAQVDFQADSTSGEEGEKRKHEKATQPEVLEMVEGALEIMPDGYGFLRKTNYLQSPKDIYIPPQYIRRFGLRPGDWITGPGKLQRETDRYQAILYIKEVNGLSPEKMIGRPQFDQLTPIYPDVRFVLETSKNELSTRIIDLVAPIGKGQRGMIVSPPKAGKTILLQKIANAIATNNPETKLIVLLIDERPEEVTDMQRSINGEVVYSTFDKTPENHVKVVELVLERAMRLVELGQDVVILLDSITRLARAYNLTINPTGRTLSGGLDPGALYGPKRFFGSARNIENGGSLTIIATSLIDTGSRMDEVIFEEFKGTGNMEVYLDRKLSEKRIFPAIDLNRSGTRREELLLSKRELDAVWTIRKAFGQLDTSAVTEMIINLLLKTNHNSHFVSSVNVSLNDKVLFDAMRGTKPGGNNPGNTNNTNSNGNNYSSSNSY